MPTAPSSTEPSIELWPAVPAAAAEPVRPLRPWNPDEVRHAVVDTGHLLRFTVGTVRKPKVLKVVWTVLALITLSVLVAPALASGAGAVDGTALTVREDLLPAALLGFLTLAAAGGIATGGGRQLLSGDQSSAYPVSATTDYLGSLLLAPMSTAWLLQAWFLLGATAYGVGLGPLLPATLLVAGWIVVATVTGQGVAWAVEHVRRGPYGVWLVRGLGAALALAVAGLQHAGVLVDVVDSAPTAQLVEVAADPGALGVVASVLGLLAALAVALLLGGAAANVAARRLPRDEAKAETRHHAARPDASGVGGMLRRIDRASVWRAVPMRRGIAVLAVGPGLVALVGGLSWDNIVILPGLVVSGGVLLFGVNAFSLDGRGGLWRESLPVEPRAVFRARSQVMAEWLLLASLVTVWLASLRAGMPSASEAVAVVATVAVVTGQVVAVAMSWSVRRPYAVALNSVRATPAPPSVMVGYSAKLALSTTMTAMVFSISSQLAPWHVVAGFALPFLLWSWLRWCRAARVWCDPVRRASVVTTVAA